MKITSTGWKNRDFLFLGVQTNPGSTLAVAHWKAHKWAPKKAKSFTLTMQHTDYHGMSMAYETGYADVRVHYFTTLKEGATAVDRDAPCPEQRKVEC